MQSIIKNNVRCKNSHDQIKLIIYYKSQTVTSLVMRNNQAPPTPELQQTNLIYEYNCTLGDCEHLPNASYVGLTTTTLSRRITMHLQSGGPKDHAAKKHDSAAFTRDALVNNTKIIRRENDFSRLQRYEALLIQQKNPIINNQETGSSRTLKLFNFSNPLTTRRLQPPNSSRPTVPQPANITEVPQEDARTTGSQPAPGTLRTQKQGYRGKNIPKKQISSSQPIPINPKLNKVPLRRSIRVRNISASQT